LKNVPSVAIPPLKELIGMYEDLASACGTFLRPKTMGVALNTSKLGSDEAREACRAIEAEVGLPCVDPLRDGVSRLVKSL
jgi:uncharacterized NAD-dependent epimerase/dehydratase family protein